ncbi:MAG: BamA/TamA family outer membrane protein [Balneolaceae bacterium]
MIVVSLPETGLQAQNRNTDDNQEDTEKVVRIIRFAGNDNVRTSTLQNLIRTSTNREFLGIPRFTPWYYVWQLFGSIGESPTLLDREMVANDIERIKLFYQNIGYFETTVDTTIIEYRKNRVEVSFLINEGPASTIRTVAFTGLPDFNDSSKIRRFYNESNYRGTVIDDSTFRYNQQYDAVTLRAEQTRIINFLKNNGYASVQRDSVKALIKPDPEDRTRLDVLFAMNPGRIFSFGDMYVNIAGPQGAAHYDIADTIRNSDYTTAGKSIFIQIQSDAQTKPELVTNHLRFRPGDTFNQAAYIQSVNEYQNLGMLFINRFGLSEDSSLPDYSKEEIPVYFDFQTLPKHSVRTELFGMRRFGFGTGAGLNYSNNNVFGAAENLTIGINANFEVVTPSTLSEIVGDDDRRVRTTIFRTFEGTIDYSVPRLNFPFAALQQSNLFQNARTRYALTYSQSNQLFFDINFDLRFNLRYEVTHSPRFSSFLDLLEMDIVDSDPSSEFRQNLINEFGEGSFELERILEDFRPQFSSIIRYTLRSSRTNIIKRNFGHFSEFSISTGGNFPYLLDRFVFTPGEINETIPSPFGISSNALAYSRFVKLTADIRRYIPFAPNSVFAYRFFGGFAQPYGRSSTISLNRRFFAGGSNDIRGYAPFRLGPGAIAPEDVTINGGEIKLAAFTEIRQRFIQNLLSAEWQVAWFTDAGNIWYGPRNSFRDEENRDILREGKFFIDTFFEQIPVSSGLGVRLDWDFLVARIDFAFRINDLQQGWFKNRNAFFSFGIGHSF